MKVATFHKLIKFSRYTVCLYGLNWIRLIVGITGECYIKGNGQLAVGGLASYPGVRMDRRHRQM